MKTSIFLSSRSHMITHRAARNNSSIQFVRYLLYLVCTLCVTSFLVCLMSFNVYTIHLNVICRSQICDGLIQCTIIITVSCFVSQFWQLYTWWCWCVYTRCDGHILSSSSMLCVRSLFFSHSFWHSFEFVQIQNVCLCVGANHSHLQVLVLRFVCNFMAQSTPVHVICHTIFEYLCGAQIFLCLARTHSHILCAYVYDVHLIF